MSEEFLKKILWTFPEQDVIKTILNFYEDLQQKVEQLENIRKEAIEYINNNSHYYSTDTHEEGFVIDTENEEMFCNIY